MRIRAGDLAGARDTADRLAKAHPTHPRTELAKGRVELADNRIEEAATTLRRYVGVEDTAEGEHLLASAELRRGNFPAAVAAIDRALELGGTNLASALRLKATIHAAAGDHPQTLQTLNRMQRDVGRLRNSDKLLLAQTLYAMNRRPRAKAVLEELLAEEKPPVAALVEFAQREMQREPQRARGYLEQALERQPTNPQALRLMAQVDLGAGRPADALARIDKAAEQGPLPPALLLLRAQVLASQKDWTGAEEEARRAFAASPTLPGALELLANIYVAQGRLDEAIASFLEAEKAGALPPSGQQLLARLYLTSGRTAEAKPLYEKVLAARADMPGAKNDLAWILAQEGNELDRALTLAQEAQQAEPESPEVADTLGYVYLQKGLHGPALEQFEYAIELSQRRARNDAAAERPDYHYHKGLALQSLGRAPEAADAYGRALSLDADFAQADDARRRLEATKSGAAGPG
jgi:tetratricopeptide (TPR) repeat protein